MALFKRQPRRENGDLTKNIYIRDDEILYRQFVDGAGLRLNESLEKAYDELKICRSESQSASNHAMIAFAILACVYFGVIESLESLGLKISQTSVLHFALLASATLSFRAGYVKTRVTFLRAIYSAHLKKFKANEKADWLARHPLAYMSLEFYSPTFLWPDYLIPQNKRMIFELVEVLLIGLGAVGWGVLSLWITMGSCFRILSNGFNIFSVATVVASLSLYLGMFFFPKYGSRERVYRHTGLMKLIDAVEIRSPERKEYFLRKIWAAQDNLKKSGEKAP